MQRGLPRQYAIEIPATLWPGLEVLSGYTCSGDSNPVPGGLFLWRADEE